MKKELLAAVGLAVFLSACSGADSLPTSPTYVPLPLVGGGTPRVTAQAEIDRAPLGSVGMQCANDKPVMTQANGRGGSVLFEFRIGHGTSKAELWVFKRRNEPGKAAFYALAHKFEVGDGNPATYKSSYDTTAITEEGHYYVIVRRLKCGNNINAIGEFSDLKEFTVGSPYDPSPEPVEQEGALTCEDGWREVEGADPAARCLALLG